MNDMLPDNRSMAGGFPPAFGGDPSLLPTASSRRDPLRRQQALVAMGRRVVAPPGVEILLQDAAAMIAEMLDAEHHLVAELSPESGRLRLTLTSRELDGGNPQVSVHEATVAGAESLAGFALQVAHPIVVNDLVRETRFQDVWLRKQGVASALAVPMKLPDRAYGALAACSTRVRTFEPEDILFTETIAHLVTATIARIEVEKTLQAEREFSAGVMQTVGALVLVLDPQGRIRHINRACERQTGFAPAELKGRPIWDVLIAPDEVPLFRILFQKLLEGISPVDCQGLLLTKHSQQQHVAWSCSAVTNSAGGLLSIIVTGIDITQQPKADPAEAANRERRRRPRRSYPYRQLIAPVLDGKLPPADAYAEIECNDIGAGGFSYLASQPPLSHSLVVALGSPPALTHLSAEVAHVTRVKHAGQTMYLIGCTYTGRVRVDSRELELDSMMRDSVSSGFFQE